MRTLFISLFILLQVVKLIVGENDGENSAIPPNINEVIEEIESRSPPVEHFPDICT